MNYTVHQDLTGKPEAHRIYEPERNYRYAAEIPALPFQHTPQVLLVEDIPTIQFIHKRFLELLGCLVDVAGDAPQALAKNEQNYDLVLVDIKLPGMSGLELSGLLRNRMQNTPIIGITANPELRESELALASMNEIIVKPMPLSRFAEMLKRWLL